MLCTTEPIPEKDVLFINECIKNDYALNWVVDDLPAAHISNDERTSEEYYSIGFALGSHNNNQPELNNHYEITIEYHHREDGKYRVVGVLVTSSSRNQKVEKGVLTPSKGPLVLKGGEQVVYTYSVKWVVSLYMYIYYYYYADFILFFILVFNKTLGYTLG